ncbi:Putative hypothetical protein [Helicobacter mustelae 12198]|uniref:Uncharacterized protein n=1 Tax=Helicobacter mustelae (strain ATCC 43772 / CCUG 25715 / CIP 103759 / LMG 18044 / NCTC 12198 / R85-136P) TaxID=679897 RepID=D3UHW9_HELM1|nr:Putative hypothetical protein [Helicobacter mustelae 12198]
MPVHRNHTTLRGVASFFHKGEGLEWQSRSLPLMDPHPCQALFFTVGSGPQEFKTDFLRS